MTGIDTFALIAEVEAEAGGADWDGEAFRDNLAFLADCIARSDPIPEVWPRLRREWKAMLCLRLHLADFARHNPAARILPARPLLVTGFPRTGTTFLHGLLAQDPAYRVIEGDDVKLVPNALETLETDSAEFKKRHITDGPLADYWFMAHEFLDMTPSNFFDIPGFVDRILAADQIDSLKWHRRSLQYLHTSKPLPRTLLDDPPFMLNPREVFATYPDSMVICTHRDPLKVLGSLSSLFAHFRERNYRRPTDRRALGAENLRLWGEALRRMLDWRDNHAAPGTIYDVEFDALSPCLPCRCGPRGWSSGMDAAYRSPACRSRVLPTRS